MPWGHPDAAEALWCIGCSNYGREFVQRRFVKGAPTERVRVCPTCHEKGWRLEGAAVEQGAFWLPPTRAARSAEPEAAA